MGSPTKPLTWMERNIPYVFMGVAGLETAAVSVLGFPIVTPVILATGVGYSTYKLARMVIEEIRTYDVRKRKRNNSSYRPPRSEITMLLIHDYGYDNTNERRPGDQINDDWGDDWMFS